MAEKSVLQDTLTDEVMRTILRDAIPEKLALLIIH
jgi:hypothetical protein